MTNLNGETLAPTVADDHLVLLEVREESTSTTSVLPEVGYGKQLMAAQSGSPSLTDKLHVPLLAL